MIQPRAMENVAFTQIGIVGTGRVARALASALAPHSIRPLLIWGRNPLHRDAAVAQTPNTHAALRLEDILACDAVALAVSDDALPDMIARMAQAPLLHRPLVFHVSGRSGAALLSSVRIQGAQVAAIHPAMTFTGDAQAERARMVGAHFAITAPDENTYALAERIVGLLGGLPVAIAEDQRTLYHAALCHAANHLVTLMTGASQALEQAGVAEASALLAPLVRAALENTLEHGFSALSGPLLRRDAQTVAGHVQALERQCPLVLPAYRAMATATLDELEHESQPPAPILREILG